MFEKRLHVLLLALAFFFFILVSRFFYLQLLQGDDYLKAVMENRIQIQYFKSERGRILDRNGVVLAKNRQTKDIAVVMSRILDRVSGQYRFNKESHRMVKNLADVMGIHESEIWDKLEIVFAKITRKPFVFKGETIHDAITIFIDIPENIVREIEVNRYRNVTENDTVILEDRFPGIEISTTQVRIYPFGSETCHIVGYTGKMSPSEQDLFSRHDIHEIDRVGKCGIERYYEEKLHGLFGKRMVEKIIEDKKIKYRPIKVEDPEPGLTLQLTLDIRLQKYVIEGFRDFEKRAGHPVKGACVILNPQNGEVLAMVSYPLFDLNSFMPSISSAEFRKIITDPGKPLINRCLRGYPPGSTWKPMVSIAAEVEHVSIPNVVCMGSITVGSGRSSMRFRCWKSMGHGEMDKIGALRESCNVYFYELGRTIGPEVIHKYADFFDFGRQTGIDLMRTPEYEYPGINPSPEWKRSTGRGGWSIGDTLNTSIGQGFVSASPLQIASYTGVIGTEGKKARPHLLRNKYDALVIEDRQILSPSVFYNTRRGMHQVTMDVRGTAYKSFRSIQALGIDSAGKTGSAEVGGNRRTHSWYCGFAPFYEPVLSYAIVVENAGHGSDAAVPIMADILGKASRNEKLRKDLGLIKKMYFVPEEKLPGINPDYIDKPEKPETDDKDEFTDDVKIIID